MPDKHEIRKDILAKRRQLNGEARKKCSLRIISNLSAFLEIEDLNIKSIHVFFPIQNEPDITELYREWLKSGLKLYAPAVTDENKLRHFRVHDLNSLRPGPLHTIEPIPEGKSVSPNFDIILVPGVAFDKKGNRIGFGKGFYDRFLMEGSGLKIGICYNFQLIEKVPVSDHDIPVDLLITEEEIISIKKGG